MTLDDFLQYIIPHANGCPEPLASLNTRVAIIELCREALIWREYQTSVATVATQTAYAYAPAAGQQVLKLISLRLNGDDVAIVDPAAGKLYDADGVTANYAYGSFSGFELRPAQVASLPIITYAAVGPTLAALTVPDSFGRYAELIAQGALVRILNDKDKMWTDKGGAERAMAAWNDGVADAKNDALLGFSRVAVRTRPQWM